MRIEDQILSNLIYDEEYARAVIPFMDLSYFKDKSEMALVEEYLEFFEKFNKQPTPAILKIELGQRHGITDSEFNGAIEKLDSYKQEETTNREWLLEQTEEFCRKKSIYNAIIKSLSIIDGKDKEFTEDAIPKLLQDALAVSFDSQVGHNYLADAASRYDFYTNKEERLPFDIDLLNVITKGGLPRKTLTVLVAESGGGKSLAMTHMASSHLKAGKNVLYITLEMAEERISERNDANILNLDIDAIASLTKQEFVDKIDKISAKTNGRLFVKEYPTGAAHTGHFRGLCQELKTKQNFKPDVIYVDYLGICASSRMKMGGSINSYTYMKSISEELRAFAKEMNVPLITAVQVNRGGFGSSDLELDDIAESMGIVFSTDLILALIRTEELDELGQLMIKQLKNRYGDLAKHRRFVVGVNLAKMKLYDLEAMAQSTIQKDATMTPKNQAPPKPSGGFDDFVF